jgi:hypothetical protein
MQEKKLEAKVLLDVDVIFGVVGWLTSNYSKTNEPSSCKTTSIYNTIKKRLVKTENGQSLILPLSNLNGNEAVLPTGHAVKHP